jgi:hypothetical protein
LMRLQRAASLSRLADLGAHRSEGPVSVPSTKMWTLQHRLHTAQSGHWLFLWKLQCSVRGVEIHVQRGIFSSET